MLYVSGFPPHKTDSKNKLGVGTLNKANTKTKVNDKAIKFISTPNNNNYRMISVYPLTLFKH